MGIIHLAARKVVLELSGRTLMFLFFSSTAFFSL